MHPIPKPHFCIYIDISQMNVLSKVYDKHYDFDFELEFFFWMVTFSVLLLKGFIFLTNSICRSAKSCD